MIFRTTKQLWEDIQENKQCKHTPKTACLGARMYFQRKTNYYPQKDLEAIPHPKDFHTIKSGYTPTLRRHGSAKSLHWTFGGEKPDHRAHTGMWQADDGHQLCFHASAKISTTTTTHTSPIFAVGHSGFWDVHPLLMIYFHGWFWSTEDFVFLQYTELKKENKRNHQCFRTPSLTYQRSSCIPQKHVYDIYIHIDWDRHTGTERERDRERQMQVDWDKLL